MAEGAMRLAALAAMLVVALGSSWVPCSKSSNYPVTIKDVEVEPDPVVSGKEATFSIPATTSETITSGRVVITVLFHNIPVHREVDDLCEKASCPIAPGDFVLKHSQVLPGITPPGSYKIKLQMYNGSKLLACAQITFNIVWDKLAVSS